MFDHLDTMRDHIRALKTAYQGPDKIPPAEITTLMLRNLPHEYTVELVLAELRRINLMDYVDFAYMPWDVRCEANINYMFVNFVTPEHALHCFFALSGRAWSLVQTQKCCRIVPAHVQGLAANLSNYLRATRGEQQAGFSPSIFHGGQRIDLDDMKHKIDRTPELSWYSGHLFQEEQEEANITQSLPASGADGSWDDDADDSFDPDLEDVLEFRRAFKEFCKTATSEHASGAGLSKEHISGDLPKHVQFWLQLRRLCSAFAEQSQHGQVAANEPFIPIVNPAATRQDLSPPGSERSDAAAALPCLTQEGLGEAATHVPLPRWSRAGINKGREGVRRCSDFANARRANAPGPTHSRGPLETSGAYEKDQAHGVLADDLNADEDDIFAARLQ